MPGFLFDAIGFRVSTDSPLVRRCNDDIGADEHLPMELGLRIIRPRIKAPNHVAARTIKPLDNSIAACDNDDTTRDRGRSEDSPTHIGGP